MEKDGLGGIKKSYFIGLKVDEMILFNAEFITYYYFQDGVGKSLKHETIINFLVKNIFPC